MEGLLGAYGSDSDEDSSKKASEESSQDAAPAGAAGDAPAAAGTKRKAEDEHPEGEERKKKAKPAAKKEATSSAESKAAAPPKKLKLPSAAAALQNSAKPSFLQVAESKGPVYDEEPAAPVAEEPAVQEAPKAPAQPEAAPNLADQARRAMAVIDQQKADKKQRDVKSFRQKEKRKREIGQASRGSNYVENEKRLLRETTRSVYGGD